MSYSDFSPVTDLDNLVSTLEEYGVAVLPSVFTDSECDQFRAELFAHLRAEHNIVGPNDVCNVAPIQGGAMFKYGLSLTKPVLDVKTSDKALAPFKRFFPNDSEFTTSLDGMFIGPPPEEMSEETRTKSGGGFFDPAGSFFHTDQASDKVGFCCAQSYITFEATEHGDGCLTVFIRSNKYHQEFFEHFGLTTNGENFYQINTREHQDWYVNEKGCEWKMISAPRGSMVFWDSRTIHYFASPRLARPHPDRWRLQVYVCYTPARLQTERDAETKRNAYINNQCTDHWPYNVKKLFDKDKNDTRINSLSQLTERHRKYLGF